MNRVEWWLVDAASRILEPDERAAVLGDVTESGETGGQALLGVLGLVIRRQADLWIAWRPWLTLVGVILPLGMLLSIVSRTTANGSAVYVWMYANNWDVALMRNPGFWRLFVETIANVTLWYLTLACWSWTSGFALGSISRGMQRINGILLILMLMFGELVGAPSYFAYLDVYLHRAFGVPSMPDYNAAVFDIPFYRVMFPLIVQIILVAVPALWGLRQGWGSANFTPLVRTILGTAAIATLVTMALQEREVWILLGPHFVSSHPRFGIELGRVSRVLGYVAYWPLAYAAANAVRRHVPKAAMLSM